jgi:hypothetical protein
VSSNIEHRARARVCVCARARARVRVRVCVCVASEICVTERSSRRSIGLLHFFVFSFMYKFLYFPYGTSGVS